MFKSVEGRATESISHDGGKVGWRHFISLSLVSEKTKEMDTCACGNCTIEFYYVLFFFSIIIVGGGVLVVGYFGSSNCGWSSKEFDANMRAGNGGNS